VLPGIFAALVAAVLHPVAVAGLAYAGGTLGTLLGADLVNLPKARRLGAPVVSIGGAGTFDASYQERYRRQYQRRDRLVAHPDGQVGASPHDPYDEQRGPRAQAGPPRQFCLFLTPNGRWCFRFLNDPNS